ncbi:MAG: CDF family Co(II)/Ni(II) efflux transporter DmeF [Rhodomicrobium sp.]|nr:CDF family Co(II)/Ni(II) efflux transporter DmeF [Rhodomicrobium sp.]
MNSEHVHPVEDFQHEHVFLGARHGENEKRVWAVVAITTVMMIAEIAGGTVFGSLALVADGWHMSTHAAALTISALAYFYARRHVHDERFAFGTGKLGDLASFASAIILGMVALLIGYESVDRLFNPVAIAYDEAIAIAVLGLAVNLASAWLLRDDHAHHHHDHGHQHEHGPGHSHAAHDRHDGDLNLRAAYVHVLADALTSVLAIGGLLAAKIAGWTFMDPVVGLVGAGVILSWSYGLARQSGAVLIDSVPDRDLAGQIRKQLEANGDAVSDLHLWRVGPGHYAAMVSILSDHPAPPQAYKDKLVDLPRLSHVTVEVERCPGHVPG